MAIQPDHTSVVVLGAWNPAIVQPTWLLQHAIVKKPPAAPALQIQPLTRAFRFELAGLEWNISDSRLQLVSRQKMRNCGTYAGKVLAILKHTPIQAVGTNFTFFGDEAEWPNKAIVPTPLPVAMAEGKPLSFALTTWQGAADLGKDTLLNITVAKNESTIVVSFNFHRNCTGDASKARVYARRWGRDHRTVKGILNDSFGVTPICQ